MPVKRPEDVLKEAQAGIPVMLKVKISPSGSFVVERKFKASPTLISEILPEIVGAKFWGTGAEEVPPPHENKKVKTKHLIKKTFIQINSFIVKYVKI